MLVSNCELSICFPWEQWVTSGFCLEVDSDDSADSDFKKLDSSEESMMSEVVSESDNDEKRRKTRWEIQALFGNKYDPLQLMLNTWLCWLLALLRNQLCLSLICRSSKKKDDEKQKGQKQQKKKRRRIKVQDSSSNEKVI